jgi:hypothetical protein
LTVGLSAVISTFVPSIRHLAGILAAGADLMLAYGLPCLFAAAIWRGVSRQWVLGMLEAVFAVTVVASVGGVAVSVWSFVQGGQ